MEPGLLQPHRGYFSPTEASVLNILPRIVAKTQPLLTAFQVVSEWSFEDQLNLSNKTLYSVNVKKMHLISC